jgi:hypothetical protein
MTLVPSGRWRLMVAQTMGQNDPAHNGVGSPPAPPGSPAPRNDIEQNPIGGNTPPADGAAPEAPPAGGDPQMPAETMGQGGADELSVEPIAQEGEDTQQQQNPETSLKAYVFNVLEHLGVPPRQLQTIPDIFSQEIDFDSNTVTGHYLVPTYTAHSQIDEKKAIQIARKIGQRFGLSQKMKLEHRNGVTNWRVSFQTMPKQSVQQGGSSFDAFQGQSNFNKGSGAQNRAAFTMGEMIKARRDDLYETMRKIAQGSKNDS